tara:strand:+ start:9125 stop:10231 length:1107 start_codon:yes stop_codon:yes gene_type:complete
MGKQVKTPRFYVDMVSFLHATGQLGWDATPKGGAKFLYMNCSNPFLQIDDNRTVFRIGHDNNNPPKTSFPINFVALLNHNFASDTNNCKVVGKYIGNSHGLCNNNLGFTEVLNANHYEDGSNDFIDPVYNGTSIWTINTLNRDWTNFDIYFSEGIDDYTHQLGSFVVGKYWDAPNSPDLKLTMERRFDGIKKTKTIGGKTLANIYYDGPTEWTMNHPVDNDLNGTYKYPPFELDTTAQVDTAGYRFDYRAKSGLGRKGLRSWNLTFSYIDGDDMWMKNEVSSKVINDSIDDGSIPTGGSDPSPMLSDDSFNFVWNCTLGGTLPFIFQPDNTNNAPDQFSICTFASNSLKINQVAPNVYNLSVTIDEVA